MSVNLFTVDVLPNAAPTIALPIPDATVLQGFSFVNSFADLTKVFVDSDGPLGDLSYALIANSNSTLVSSTISSGNLNLALASNLSGTSTLTVRATDAGGLSVDEAFVITVLAHDTTPPVSAVAALPDLSLIHISEPTRPY